MNTQKLVAAIKEKGPVFLLGAMIGAVVVYSVVKREKIATTINHALGRNQ